MRVREIEEKLSDPQYYIVNELFEMMVQVKRLYKNYSGDRVNNIICQMLLRLRIDCPRVFELVLEDYPEYMGIEDFWKSTDTEIRMGSYG